MGFNQPAELDQYRKNTRSFNVVMGEAERRERERGDAAAHQRAFIKANLKHAVQDATSNKQGAGRVTHAGLSLCCSVSFAHA